MPKIPRVMSTQHPDNVCLPFFPDNIKSSLRRDAFDFKVDYEHKKVTGRIINALKENHHTDLKPMIEEAAYLRRFLG